MCKYFIPDKIKLVLNKLHVAGFEAYVVGGCVRDTFLCKEPKDWDITTSATPDSIKKVFENYQQIDSGIKHGTVMVVIDKEVVEITTFRIDGEYSDGRRPDSVIYTQNIIEDLSRRDFTINACAISDTELIDPFGGQEDIRKRLIRCVGNPKERFNEDALRILRGIRFASVLNFSVEDKTKIAMLDGVEKLKNVSQERITVEFSKMLLGENVYNTLLEFKSIIAYIIPEVLQMIGFEQNNPHHIYTVYEHTLKAVASIDSDIVLRATMFFHDIAKPSCYSIDKNGVGHFYGHPEVSAQITERILQRMKYPTREVMDITELIKYHDAQIGNNSNSIKRLLNKIGELQFRRLLKVKRADILAQSLQYKEENLEKLRRVEKIFEDVIANNKCFSISMLAINGYDLIELGLCEGKQIGVILKQLLEKVMDEEIKNTKEELINEVKKCL